MENVKHKRLRLPEGNNSGTSRLVVADKHTSVGKVDRFVTVKSVNEASSGYFSKKGVTVCSDFISPTADLSDFGKVKLYVENGKNWSSATVGLIRHKYQKGFSHWSLTDFRRHFINLKDSVLQEKSDLNLATLMFTLRCLKIPFSNGSNDDDIKRSLATFKK